MDRATYTAKISRRSGFQTARQRNLSSRHFSNLAEDYVTTMAVLHGWNIYARNYRRPGTELDIVMEKNGVLSIVEVKLRNGPALVESMLAPAKRQALVRGAYQFLAETFYQADIVRFDLAVVGVKNGRAYLRLYKSDVFQA